MLAFTAILAAGSILWLLILPRLGRTHDLWDREYDAAREALEAGRIDEARGHMLAAVELAPRLGSRAHEPRVLSALGMAEIELQAGNRDEAERCCRTAMDLLGARPVEGVDAGDLLRRIQGDAQPPPLS